jgi:signal transduction histidine kinase
MTASPTSEYRVAVVATTATDADIAQRVLLGIEVSSVVCADVNHLCAAIEAGLGAVVLAEEVLTPLNMERLTAVLERQPPWSGLPFVILTRPSWGSRPAAALHTRLPDTLLIERPVRIEHLLSAIRTSLVARRRQYATRDLLYEAQRAADERGALQVAAENARAAAEAANRMKDEFLAVLSHELRTPLNAILGWATLLQKHTLGEEQTRRAIESIERNSRLQAQLIDDLLDVSRVITGTLRLEIRSLDLSTVVEEAMGTVLPTSAAKGVTLERGNWQSVAVNGDAARLQQVAWNLLTNAIKFTPRGGRVRVEVHEADGCAELKVIDSGEGIGAEALPHVFERFWQADSTSTRTRGGLGLGLAIVKQVMELHSGTVAVTSAGRGLGATFTVRLPRAARAAVAAQAGGGQSELREESARKNPLPLSGINVLVVDDDTESLQVMATALSESGARVSTASSAAEAWTVARNQALDVVISDISMPREDGYSFIRRLRADTQIASRCSPTIALTAHARQEDREATRAAGFTAHLAKPVDPAELIRCILECRSC